MRFKGVYKNYKKNVLYIKMFYENKIIDQINNQL